MFRLQKIIVGVFISSGLSGCGSFNQFDIEYSRTTTVGKELMDLHQAYEDGIVSDSEYVKLKEEVMKGGPISLVDPNE